MLNKMRRSVFILFGFLFLFATFIHGLSLSSNRGFRRQIDIISILVSNNASSPLQLFITYRKYNRTNLAFTANFTLKDYIDKRYKFKLEVQKWGDGGWKRNLVYYENNDPCKQLKLTIGPLFKTIMDFIRHPPKCPFQPGFYHFDDYAPLSKNNDVAPVFTNFGRNKIIMDFYKDRSWLNRYEQVLEINEINS